MLKKGIWAYFLLLLFEGALRKWFLPGLSMPLLIVRDPLVLLLLILASREGLLPKNPYLTGIWVIGTVATLTAVFFGHHSLPVALFGARILLLHLPFIFLIGRVFTREDVIKMGKVTLWICIPMTVLIALQFYSPQSAWVNRGVGGNTEGAGFSGAMDFMRPPATFSFTNGTTLFYSLVAPFIFYFWLNPKEINRILLISATIGLLAAIPLTISRALLFQVAITLIFTIIAVSRKPKYLGKMALSVAGGLVVLLLLGKTGFFQTSVEAFTMRFDTANEVEGGLQGVLLDRFLGGMVSALSNSYYLPFFGFGLGMGSQVGSNLLAGKQVFLISEQEWGRWIGELGPLMGISIIFIRTMLAATFFKACYRKLVKSDLLPWLLLSFGFLSILQGETAQPTSLGFCVMISGLLVASLRKEKIIATKKVTGIKAESNFAS